MTFEDDCKVSGCIVCNYSFNQHYTLYMKRREVVFYNDPKANREADPIHDHRSKI